MKKHIGSWLKLFAIIALFNIGIFAQRNLTDPYWELTVLNGRRMDDSNAYLNFDAAKKKISGNAGCNSFFGSYSVRSNSIKFSKIGTTKMFCTKPGVMKDENEFIRALSAATRYAVTRKTLSIYEGRKKILEFKEQPIKLSLATTILAEKKWFLDGVKEREPDASKDVPFIVFDEDKGSAGGNTGCNVFGGSYSVKEYSLSITEVISTMRACIEDDRMDTERNFLDGLSRTTRFELKDDQLLLYEKDKLLLTFTGYDK